MLTLTFLGVGSAFAKRNLNSNALIEGWAKGPAEQGSPDDSVLIDFGTTGPKALHQIKDQVGFQYLDQNGLINYPAIRRVLITHLHADHIGGLEEMALMTRFGLAEASSQEERRLELIGTADVLSSLWEHSLKGGLGASEGRPAKLKDYFTVRTVHERGKGTPDRIRIIERYEISLFRTHHIQMTGPLDWPSYGLLIADPETGETVVFSGDTQFDPQGLGNMLAHAGMVFHDVQLEDSESPVHAPMSALRTLPEEIRRKMILYHFADEWDGAEYDSVAKEFAGFAEPMRRYVLFGGG